VDQGSVDLPISVDLVRCLPNPDCPQFGTKRSTARAGDRSTLRHGTSDDQHIVILVGRVRPEPGTVEAMVERVVHLGFEVRVELSLSDGERVVAQLSRHDADQYELSRGDIVHVRSTEAAPESVSV